MKIYALVAAGLFIYATTSQAQTPVPASPFGLGWGVGIGWSVNLVGREIVATGDAFVDSGGILRVTRATTARSRLLAEAHYTFSISDAIGIGPVMFLQPSDAGLFDAAGGGIVIELGGGGQSMNVIIGALLDFDVEQLHQSYIDGFPSPTSAPLHVSREQLQLLIGFVAGF